MSDENNDYRYDKMVEQALRSVVKTAIEEVIEKGLIDDHHFYITFRTDHPGVDIPQYLKDRYPGEMTIVLQHQFYDLEVNDKRFTVMLKFSNVPERLVIPLAAITIFTDPSVNFALQFQPLSAEDEDVDYGADEMEFDDDLNAAPKKKGEVVSLDQFRSTGRVTSPASDNEEEDQDEEKTKPSKSKKVKKDTKKDKAKKDKNLKDDKDD